MVELLVGFQLRVVFHRHVQFPQQGRNLRTSLDLFRFGCIGNLGTQFGNASKYFVFMPHICLDGCNQIGNQVVPLFQGHADAALALLDTVLLRDKVI